MKNEDFLYYEKLRNLKQAAIMKILTKQDAQQESQPIAEGFLSKISWFWKK